MSAFSDFLTQDAAPWWGSGLIGIGGTLLGIGINSLIANKRDDKQANRDAKIKLSQDQLDDRRRWEVEIRDYVIEVNQVVDAVKSNILVHRRDRLAEDQATTDQFLIEQSSKLDRIRRILWVIAPTEIYSTTDEVWRATVMLRHTRDAHAFEEVWESMIQKDIELTQKVRVALRVPEEI